VCQPIRHNDGQGRHDGKRGRSCRGEDARVDGEARHRSRGGGVGQRRQGGEGGERRAGGEAAREDSSSGQQLLWRTGGVGVGEDVGGDVRARFDASGEKRIGVREMERRGKNGKGKK
jgi:hypothetical protein